VFDKEHPFYPANTEGFWSYAFVIGALITIFVACLKHQQEYEKEKVNAREQRAEGEGTSK
jgi:hypothetical protein